MKKIVLLMIFTLVMLSFAYAATNDSVKLILKYHEKFYKEKYSAGDQLVMLFNIEESCNNFGYLMGSFEFNEELLRYDRMNIRGIEIEDKDDDDGTRTVYPQYLNVGLDDKSNQIIFWIEDKKSMLTPGNLASIFFVVNRDCNASDINFKLIKAEASDYDLKNKINVSFSQSNNDVQLKKDNEEINVIVTTGKPVTTTNRPIANSNELEIKNVATTNKPNETNKKTGTDSTFTTAKPKETLPIKLWSKSSNWAEEELANAQKKDLIPESFKDMDFSKVITRKEFAAVAVKLYEALTDKKATISKQNPFNDTNDSYVLKAYELEITSGVSEDRFAPEKEINREQMATMMFRALKAAKIDTSVDLNKVSKFEDDNLMHTWSREAIYSMSEREIINGISKTSNIFGVENNATIEQALAISVRSFDKLKK